jgi:LPPG:FO 2-phospho-L-lactate transferase
MRSPPATPDGRDTMTTTATPSRAAHTQLAVLAGGVGAARMLRGVRHVLPDEQITALVNTADDTVLHGLHISPDLDTVTYTLAGAIDPERGWGLAGETWTAMGALARFATVRPAGSAAGATWFNLGDQDLATHMYRTARLAEGATLTEVTAEIATAWDLGVRLLPMTDDRVATRITLAAAAGANAAGDEIGFQEYFVQHHHDVPAAGVRFDGVEQARPNGLDLLATARAVLIAPSNPIVSIGPLRALTGVDAALAARRDTVVGVSPIIAGSALKGPADRLLRELGMEPSVVGVARLYAPVCGTLVIDQADADLAGAVEAEGVRCVVTATVMSDATIAGELARACLAAVGWGVA